MGSILVSCGAVSDTVVPERKREYKYVRNMHKCRITVHHTMHVCTFAPYVRARGSNPTVSYLLVPLFCDVMGLALVACARFPRQVHWAAAVQAYISLDSERRTRHRSTSFCVSPIGAYTSPLMSKSTWQLCTLGGDPRTVVLRGKEGFGRRPGSPQLPLAAILGSGYDRGGHGSGRQGDIDPSG